MPATPRKRKAEWDELCRRGIQDAVVRLIARGDANALTMEDVAAEAGVAKGTLYLYFRDKKQLLTAVKEASLRPMWTELLEIVDSPLPPREKIRRFVERHLGYVEEHRGLFRLLLWDRQIAETSLRRAHSLPFRAHVERVSRMFREGIAAGEFRDEDPLKLASILVESDVALIGRRFMTDAPGPVEDDARLLADLVCNGLAVRRTAKGRRT